MRLALALLFLVPTVLSASVSVETAYSGSAASMEGVARVGYGFGQKDLDSASLGFTRTRTFNPTGDAHSSVLDLGLEGPLSEAFGGSLGLSWDRDDGDNINSFQPDTGLSWAWKGEADEDGTRPTYLKLSLGSGLAFYSMDVSAHGRGPLGRTRTAKATLTLDQVSPHLKLSLPLLDGDLTPYAS